MLEGQFRSTGLHIPNLDRLVAGGTSEDVLGCRIEENVADLPVSV